MDQTLVATPDPAPIPLRQSLSGERVYMAAVTWKPYGTYLKPGWTGLDDVSVREGNIEREYGGCTMLFSWPATQSTEKWLLHQFALERLSREQSGKDKGWHPTELLWPSDKVVAWAMTTAVLDTTVRIECGTKLDALSAIAEVYRDRWNRGSEEAA